MATKTITLACSLSVALATPAAAQLCRPDLKSWADDLLKRHGEVPVAKAETLAGGGIVRFESPGGSWTLVIVLSDGRTCMLTAGTDWREFGGGV